MRTIFPLGLLIALTALVSANPATDSQKSFTVNVPDNWKYTTQVNYRGVKENGWKEAKNRGALTLTTFGLGETGLDDWAKMSARQNPKAIVSSDTLGGKTAKRVDFTTRDGYITTIWLTTQNKKGAMITLVHTKECPDDIAAISKALVDSLL